MFQHTKWRYIYRFQNLSLGFILKIFLKLRKFQPRYNLVKKLSVQFSRPTEIRKMPDNAKRNITKTPAEHPKYEEMIKTAIRTLFIWMFLLDCCWLSGVKLTCSDSWMAIDSQTEVLALKIFVGYIPLLLFRKWSKTGTEAMLSRHKLQADADFKPALLGSH